MNKNEFEKRVWESNMNQTGKIIALAVASHGDWDTGLNVKPSKTRIAGMAECTRDTAGKYIDALEEQGWLRYVKTHSTNKKEYALSDSVVEPVGILAKRTRNTSKAQKDNLKNPLVEAIDNQLPTVTEPVADSIDNQLPTLSTLPYSPYSSNLTDLTSDTPVSDEPVESQEDFTLEVKDRRKRFLNGPESQAFTKLMFTYSVKPEDAELVKSRYECKTTLDRSLNFEERIKDLLRDIDYVIGGDDEW